MSDIHFYDSDPWKLEIEFPEGDFVQNTTTGTRWRLTRGGWSPLERVGDPHPWLSGSAFVAPWATLGRGSVVHPFAVVGRLPDHSVALARTPVRTKELSIGPRVAIGCHAVIFGGSEIGEDSLIGDFAHIREGVRIGKRCVIGRYVAISYDTEIADDCRFQDGAVITAKVGRGCFFGVGVITSNDRNVDLVKYHHPKPRLPVFGERVMVGSGANILAGVTIGDDALIGSGAVVVDDVPAGARVLGSKATQR